MQQAISQAQQVIGATTPGATTTTTTTAPPVKGGKTTKKAATTTTTTPRVDVDVLVDHHLGADEHRAQERHDHLDARGAPVDAGLGGARDLRAGVPATRCQDGPLRARFRLRRGRRVP